MDLRRVEIRRITTANLPIMESLVRLFGEVFADMETYTAAPPSPSYLESLLAAESVFAFAAIDGARVVGGLVAYELRKFERERSEIYLYDLAVSESHRRQGIATSLIKELQGIARSRGAYVIFVQADTGPEDAAAIALYSKLGTPEEVLHFDIQTSAEPGR